MRLDEIRDKLHPKVYEAMAVDELRPVQEKCIKAGLLEGRSQLVCTPTASGKTLVAELAFARAIMERNGKAIYIVPLKALASEKYNDFLNRYGKLFSIALSIGDLDRVDSHLADKNLIICTSEKLDSMIRHHVTWLRDVRVVIVDEIHLLNDPGRGPTLEILITLLREMISNLQLIGLSATIGNPQELADWLSAELIEDSWRPVELRKGIYLDGDIEFFK